MEVCQVLQLVVLGQKGKPGTVEMGKTHFVLQ